MYQFGKESVSKQQIASLIIQPSPGKTGEVFI
jgi:hypothetical protein